MRRLKEQREREISRNTDRRGDNGERISLLTVCPMTKEKRAINTNSTIGSESHYWIWNGDPNVVCRSNAQ